MEKKTVMGRSRPGGRGGGGREANSADGPSQFSIENSQPGLVDSSAAAQTCPKMHSKGFREKKSKAEVDDV
jgi:hypothetical protein